MMVFAGCMGIQAQSIIYLYENTAYGETDTIECALDHGVMLPLEGFAVTNNSNQEVTLTYKVEFVEGANISVGGLCLAGGQCSTGNTTAPFTVASHDTYEGISMEMMVPDEVDYGEYALFRITASNPNAGPFGTTPSTWMRVRCARAGIQSAQTTALQVWPNPTTDCVTITTGMNAGSSLLRVYNTAGQCVMERHMEGSDANVNLRHWPAGVYQFQLLSQDHTTATATVVKNR